MLFVLLTCLTFAKEASSCICFGEEPKCNEYIASVSEKLNKYDYCDFLILPPSHMEERLATLPNISIVIFAQEEAKTLDLCLNNQIICWYFIGLNKQVTIRFNNSQHIYNPTMTFGLYDINVEFITDSYSGLSVDRLLLGRTTMKSKSDFKIYSDILSVDTLSDVSQFNEFRNVDLLLYEIGTDIPNNIYFSYKGESRPFINKDYLYMVVNTNLVTFYKTPGGESLSIGLTENLELYDEPSLMICQGNAKPSTLHVSVVDSTIPLSNYSKISFIFESFLKISFEGVFPEVKSNDERELFYFQSNSSQIIVNTSHVPLKLHPYYSHFIVQTKNFSLPYNYNNISPQTNKEFQSHSDFKDMYIYVTIADEKYQNNLFVSISENIILKYRAAQKYSAIKVQLGLKYLSSTIFETYKGASVVTIDIMNAFKVPFVDSDLSLYETKQLMLQAPSDKVYYLDGRKFYYDFPIPGEIISKKFEITAESIDGIRKFYIQKTGTIPEFTPDMIITNNTNDCADVTKLCFTPSNISEIYQYFKKTCYSKIDIRANFSFDFNKLPEFNASSYLTFIATSNNNINVEVKGKIKIDKLVIGIRVTPIAATELDISELNLCGPNENLVFNDFLTIRDNTRIFINAEEKIQIIPNNLKCPIICPIDCPRFLIYENHYNYEKGGEINEAGERNIIWIPTNKVSFEMNELNPPTRTKYNIHFYLNSSIDVEFVGDWNKTVGYFIKFDEESRGVIQVNKMIPSFHVPSHINLHFSNSDPSEKICLYYYLIEECLKYTSYSYSEGIKYINENSFNELTIYVVASYFNTLDLSVNISAKKLLIETINPSFSKAKVKFVSRPFGVFEMSIKDIELILEPDEPHVLFGKYSNVDFVTKTGTKIYYYYEKYDEKLINKLSPVDIGTDFYAFSGHIRNLDIERVKLHTSYNFECEILDNEDLIFTENDENITIQLKLVPEKYIELASSVSYLMKFKFTFSNAKIDMFSTINESISNLIIYNFYGDRINFVLNSVFPLASLIFSDTTNSIVTIASDSNQSYDTIECPEKIVSLTQNFFVKDLSVKSTKEFIVGDNLPSVDYYIQSMAFSYKNMKLHPKLCLHIDECNGGYPLNTIFQIDENHSASLIFKEHSYELTTTHTILIQPCFSKKFISNDDIENYKNRTALVTIIETDGFKNKFVELRFHESKTHGFTFETSILDLSHNSQEIFIWAVKDMQSYVCYEDENVSLSTCPEDVPKITSITKNELLPFSNTANLTIYVQSKCDNIDVTLSSSMIVNFVHLGDNFEEISIKSIFNINKLTFTRLNVSSIFSFHRYYPTSFIKSSLTYTQPPLGSYFYETMVDIESIPNIKDLKGIIRINPNSIIKELSMFKDKAIINGNITFPYSLLIVDYSSIALCDRLFLYEIPENKLEIYSDSPISLKISGKLKPGLNYINLPNSYTLNLTCTPQTSGILASNLINIIKVEETKITYCTMKTCPNGTTIVDAKNIGNILMNDNSHDIIEVFIDQTINLTTRQLHSKNLLIKSNRLFLDIVNIEKDEFCPFITLNLSRIFLKIIQESEDEIIFNGMDIKDSRIKGNMSAITAYYYLGFDTSYFMIDNPIRIKINNEYIEGENMTQNYRYIQFLWQRYNYHTKLEDKDDYWDMYLKSSEVVIKNDENSNRHIYHPNGNAIINFHQTFMNIRFFNYLYE